MTVVAPPSRAAWDEHGWQALQSEDGTVYRGDYAVAARDGAIRRFPGRIVQRRGAVTAYIADPPAAIKHHPKGPCFQLTQPPWFKVHWQRPATNVDDALLYVQKLLHEVLK